MSILLECVGVLFYLRVLFPCEYPQQERLGMPRWMFEFRVSLLKIGLY